MKLDRRSFFRKSTLGSVGIFALQPSEAYSASNSVNKTHQKNTEPFSLSGLDIPKPDKKFVKSKTLDLSPAKWIWFPSKRTLANTFVLFRKSLRIDKKIDSAKGWMLGDSRYLLEVNGHRIQWGPAPSDPRWMEADPVDLTHVLTEGEHVIGATVLFYGHGDGTWPIGKPGFIFNLVINYTDGSTETIISDRSWRCHIPRSWKPGHYKRWYLRALQEEFDARFYPYGWTLPETGFHKTWYTPVELPGPADKPTIAAGYNDYLMGNIEDVSGNSQLRSRSINHVKETDIPVKRFVSAHDIHWLKSVDDYFDFVTPDAFRVIGKAEITENSPGSWNARLRNGRSVAMTFEMDTQVVGWPYFTIEAPAGTIVELMVQQGHDPSNATVMNTAFHSWTRFHCRQGLNQFICFDYEAVQWIQLLIRNANSEVVVSKVGVKSRLYDWPAKPLLKSSDPQLQQLFNAAINTLHLSAQETIVDCMGRERQQYSGDVGHQLHAIYNLYGESKISSRYLNTFTQGITKEGFFLDTWPAYDRLVRLSERQLNLTPWGPLLDHGIAINFDSYHHYMYSGDLESLEEVLPRLLRFFEYLKQLTDRHGLIPTEDAKLGVPKIFMGFEYKKDRHKECPLNLYASAMALYALKPLCEAAGYTDWATEVSAFGETLLKSIQDKFWDKNRKLFVDNLPWLKEEAEPVYCYRSLSTAILYNQCPGGQTEASINMLVDFPDHLIKAFPANAGWRMWALGKAGRTDKIIEDFRNRWCKLPSVMSNGTIQEFWNVTPDTDSQWSHAATSPVYATYMCIAGIKPKKPGYQSYEIQPILYDIGDLELECKTVQGNIYFKAEGHLGKRTLTIHTPEYADGRLILDRREQVKLVDDPKIQTSNSKGFKLPVGEKTVLELKYT